jgi:hypothetical protein
VVQFFVASASAVKLNHRQDLGRELAVVVIAAILAALPLIAADTASRQSADLLKQKVVAIQGFTPSPSHAPHRTTLTENELNAYLTLDAPKDLPTGVVEPSLSILGPGRLSGRAVVDLDAVRREQPPKGLLDPRRLLVGRLPVTATGTLATGNGMARFSLESAAVGGIPMPKAVLQEILSYYSRSTEHPEGFNLDDPFALPSNIREIQVDRGQAIVIQ